MNNLINQVVVDTNSLRVFNSDITKVLCNKKEQYRAQNLIVHFDPILCVWVTNKVSTEVKEKKVLRNINQKSKLSEREGGWVKEEFMNDHDLYVMLSRRKATKLSDVRVDKPNYIDAYVLNRAGTKKNYHTILHDENGYFIYNDKGEMFDVSLIDHTWRITS